ncbi:replication protein [Thiofilum flexile]|uniref:replication protein n=1 Tax=Thiofilum flexile TaxID=125627 RepID=UPI00037EE2E9|nr:replication protein [Thiofilum flexile]
MSLAHELIDAALAADLSKNELKTFLVLFRQTICFGKTSDALTLKRIVKLSGTRKDRVKPTLKRLVEVGLFEATPHKIYEYTYTIAAHFLAHADLDLITPPSPKNGKDLRNSDGKTSETRIHTVIPTTDKTSTATTEREQPTKTATLTPPTITEDCCCNCNSDFVDELPYPSTWDSTQRHQAAQILDGLSPQQAHDCLLLLAHSLNKGKINNIMGYLRTLTQAARRNTLDRRALCALKANNTPRASLSVPSVTPPTPQRLNAIKAEISSLDTLFTRAGIPMDSATAAKRASYVAEYNTLKQELGG